MQLHFIFTKDNFIIDDTIELKNQNDLIWINKFKTNKYTALYEFGFLNKSNDFSSSANYLHLITSLFLNELTRCSELELARENLNLSINEEIFDQLLSCIPFVIGSEYINRHWLENIFKQLLENYKIQIQSYEGTVQMYLDSKTQHLQVPHRIYFHLVDYNDDEYPFAFIATYATKQKGKIYHVPLKHALEEYKNERNKLISLLSCLNQVAETSKLISKFMESGELFHPITLTKEEAYELLLQIPEIEKCGIKCRVPNWWKKKQSSISLSVKIGENKPSLLGLDSLLEMQTKLAISGVELTQEDIEYLLSQEDGLTFLKGQWVEVNKQRLLELLNHIKNYDKNITLKEALSMNSHSIDHNYDVGTLISNGEWLTQFITQLKIPKKIKAYKVPKTFNATLRPYQKEGYKWLNHMHELGFGACLADDMGLGKTIQVLAYLENIRKDNRVLLIVPASLIGNWEKEINTFTPKLNYSILHGKTNKILVKELIEKPQFLTITTYGLASKIEQLKEIEWDCVILDEAQAIKNPLTKQTKAIKAIPSNMRIAMTGTPIENDLSNLWSLFDFLNKGLLGTSKEFLSRYKVVDTHATNQLRNMTSPFILRRMKIDKSIISDLPDKIETIDYIDLTKKQVALYHQVMEDLKDKIVNATGMERRGLVLATLTKLKQICNHPSQYLHQSDFIPKDSGKFIMLKEICETIYEKRECILVFTQYKEICQDLSDYLETIFHKKGFIIHGGTPVKKRQEYVNQFNGEEYIPYIVLSVKAAGTGLNLTKANHVIHFDRWWNPAVENQATDRAFRIGQKKNVVVHKFVCNGSVEEKIDLLISSKKELAEQIISSNKQNWITEMSNEELLSILRLED